MKVFGITLLILYGVVMLIGRAKNSAAAARWHDECKELLVANFAEIGIPAQSLTLIQESANEYVLYGTGRRTCRSMTAKMTYPKRHNLFELLQNLLTAPAADFMTVVYDLKPEYTNNFIFAITPSRLAKKFKAEYEDLAYMTQTFNGSTWGLPQELSILTDCPSVVPELLTNEFVKFLSTHKHQVQLLHYSDFFMGQRQPFAFDALNESYGDPATAKPTLQLQFKFIAGTGATDSAATRNGALAGSIVFVDMLAKVTLTSTAKKESAKKRQAYIDNYAKEDPEVVKQRLEDQKIERLKATRERYQAMDEKNPARIACKPISSSLPLLSRVVVRIS